MSMTKLVASILATSLALGYASKSLYDWGASVNQVKNDVVISSLKLEAEKKLTKSQQERLVTQQAFAQFKKVLETNRVKQLDQINALRHEYSDISLYYRATSNGDAGPGPTNTHGTAKYELPSEITEDLRALSYDADRLLTDYRLCYDYVNR